MFYNHMRLSNQLNIYPAYMDKEAKLRLKAQLQQDGLSMYCGCSLFSEVPLEYGISTDGKIYPLHQGYVHSPLCARKSDTDGKRKSAYIVDEDGNAKAYVNFSPESFAIPKLEEEEEEAETEVDEENPVQEEPTETTEEAASTEENKPAKQEKEEKEPLDSFGSFLLQLNNDTQRERTAAGKGLLSADYFLSAVTARLKKVTLNGMKKPLRDLTMEDDAMQFFYLPLLGTYVENGGRLVLQGWKKEFELFIFEGTLLKEFKLFQNRYGISLVEAFEKGYRIMAAGFNYMRLSRKNKIYRTVGRLHLFIVNSNGLYCRNLEEVEELDNISNFLRADKRYYYIFFERVVDDPRIYGIFIQKNKKQIILCKPTVPKSIALKGPYHIAYPIKKIDAEELMDINNLLRGL